MLVPRACLPSVRFSIQRRPVPVPFSCAGAVGSFSAPALFAAIHKAPISTDSGEKKRVLTGDGKVARIGRQNLAIEAKVAPRSHDRRPHVGGQKRHLLLPPGAVQHDIGGDLFAIFQHGKPLPAFDQQLLHGYVPFDQDAPRRGGI